MYEDDNGSVLSRTNNKKGEKKDDRYVVDMASETSLSTLHAWRATT